MWHVGTSHDDDDDDDKLIATTELEKKKKRNSKRNNYIRVLKLVNLDGHGQRRTSCRLIDLNCYLPWEKKDTVQYHEDEHLWRTESIMLLRKETLCP